ncbi:unnamed protein product [Allacma fusca]|uniref:Uncharacterized protein n=1 Tax=Allacma fusca TaxID=39272 RepID=A0A8J2K759_9HEXA|nr:unnamed protein product [Allacma fusca]
MFKETKVISRASNNKGKVDTTSSFPRKTSKISLHDLNLINTKYLPDVTAAATQEDKELQQLSKMIRSHSLNDRKPPDSLLKRIIPKYKPNSRIHKPSVALTSSGINDKILKPTSFAQPLKQSMSHSEADSSSNSTSHNSSVKGHATRSSTSCIKLPHTHQPNSSRKKAQGKVKSGKEVNSKKPCRKVRFEKKITVHYVPSDEERGCYEWRKNLTRQGIYEAMLWKSEIEKIELEEAALLERDNARRDINNNNPSVNNNNNNNTNNSNYNLNNNSILAVYGLK